MNELEKAARQALDALVWHYQQRHAVADSRTVIDRESIADLVAALAKQQAEPVGWLRAIDEAMAVHEAGVADPADDYQTAKGKLNTLLCMAQDAGGYFAAHQAEPVAIPGAIPMSEVAARSRAMPERADALERARERLRQEELLVMQYIALCDAMRYSERKDELTSPEEHAESLVAELERLKQAEPVVPMDAEIVHFAKTALHEMPRPATDWHHCAKRVCEAVVAAQQAEPLQGGLTEREICAWKMGYDAAKAEQAEPVAEPVVDKELTKTAQVVDDPNEGNPSY